MIHHRTRQGFTIVELLIVIVVIGILAAITIVAFNGVQDRARVASIQAELTSSARKLEVYKLTPGNNDQYPSTLAAADISSTSSGLVYSPSGTTYCLVSMNGQTSYYVTNTSSRPLSGACVISDQLIGWWQMNNSAADTSGNNINGTNNGAVATTGQNGQANSAYQFNGTSNYIALPANAALNIANNFSVSTWVRLDSNIGVTNWNDIFAGTGANDLGVGINVNAAGVGSLMMTQLSWTDSPGSANPVTKQEWQHLVVTLSGGTINYYINGRLDSTVTRALTFTPSTKRIASRNASGYFHGALDDLRVYNKVISANEANAIYQGGAQ